MRLGPPRRLSDVERHDHDVDVRLMREGMGDPSAGPIVEQEMPPAMEVPARHDQRDLGVGPLELRDVAPEAPFDVPVVALLDVQRDPCKVAVGHPAVDQRGRSVRIARGVDAAHDRRVDPIGVVRRLEDSAVEVLDKHDRDVALPRQHLDAAVPNVVADAAVIADDDDADVRDVAKPFREPRPRPSATKPRTESLVGRCRDDQRHLRVGGVRGRDVRACGVAGAPATRHEPERDPRADGGPRRRGVGVGGGRRGGRTRSGIRAWTAAHDAARWASGGPIASAFASVGATVSAYWAAWSVSASSPSISRSAACRAGAGTSEPRSSGPIASCASSASYVLFTRTNSATSTGTAIITIQAPPANFTTAITIATTKVAIAPRPLTNSPNCHPFSRSRRCRFAIPVCESVNDVKTPRAYSGTIRVTLAPNATSTRLAAAASATMPFEKTSRWPRFVSCRGMNASSAWKLARRGKSANDVFAARIRISVVPIWRIRNSRCPTAPAP